MCGTFVFVCNVWEHVTNRWVRLSVCVSVKCMSMWSWVYFVCENVCDSVNVGSGSVAVSVLRDEPVHPSLIPANGKQQWRLFEPVLGLP